jgi:hypothetical protein
MAGETYEYEVTERDDMICSMSEVMMTALSDWIKATPASQRLSAIDFLDAMVMLQSRALADMRAQIDDFHASLAPAPETKQ